MNVVPPQDSNSLKPLEAFAVSLGFWLTLLTASAMYAILVLAPKLVELSKIQEHSVQLQALKDQRLQEVEHLHRLANAIENDAEFLARIRSNEFSLKREGTVQITVPSELGFDARVPHEPAPRTEANSVLFADSLRQFSSQTHLRRNWMWVMLGLFFVAFLFMNEAFFSGKFGRSMLRWTGNLFQRYRISASNLDGEACQRTP
ncbi:hypothetical protein OAF74_01895 [bacterium]|jgi:hypothetical protein|nr:hypothetical protein [Planctomicrobium sp.]MDB4731569.1 hypothetical protein [bacterium]